MSFGTPNGESFRTRQHKNYCCTSYFRSRKPRSRFVSSSTSPHQVTRKCLTLAHCIGQSRGDGQERKTCFQPRSSTITSTSTSTSIRAPASTPAPTPAPAPPPGRKEGVQFVSFVVVATIAVRRRKVQTNIVGNRRRQVLQHNKKRASSTYVLGSEASLATKRNPTKVDLDFILIQKNIRKHLAPSARHRFSSLQTPRTPEQEMKRPTY